MDFEQKPVFLNQAPTFEDVLDATCERLWEKHIEYSIRRIMELDEELSRLEKALDEFMRPGGEL